MQVPRIAENVELNNLALIAITTFSVLVAFGLFVVVSRWLLRRAAHASHIDAFERAVERTLTRSKRAVRITTTAVSLLVIVGACGLLAVSVWRGIDLHQWVNDGALHLTWGTLYLAVRIIGGVVAGTATLRFFRRHGEPILTRFETQLLAIEVLGQQTALVSKLVGRIQPLLTVALIYIIFNLIAEWLSLPTGLHWLVATAVYVVLVLQCGRMLVMLVHIMTDALDRLASTRFESTRYQAYYEGSRELWPLAQRSFEALTYLAVATLLVREFTYLNTFEPYGPMTMQLIGIVFLSRVVVELSRVLIHETFTRSEGVAADALKRRITLIYLIQSGVKYLIYFGAAIWMLRTVGIDPAPFLAGAGIVGLTVGLGAQKLVNDMVSGFFILFEGQMLAGDYVRIGEAEGTVEQVFLRVTKLRDLEGRLHTLRNGNIDTVINYSREWVYAVVEVSVAYQMNLTKVLQVLREAGEELCRQEPERVLDDPEIQGVEAFQDSGILIRTVTRVHPGTHLDMERRFRKIVKEFFNQHDIEIPYPRQVEIHVDSEGRPVPPRY